jgi:undecaprenyl-diphosphatase
MGIVEGISEFLPISSTGHLILTGNLLGISPTEFVKSFEISIQLGAILSVVVLYWRLLIRKWEIWKRLMVAFAPTLVLGLIFYKIVKHYLLGNSTVVICALALGGIALIAFEMWHEEKDDHTSEMEKIPYKKAFLIGLFQSIAMVPGVSRSAATIVGGLAVGLKRKTIVEFSFLLAVPTMLAATVFDLIKSAGEFTTGEIGVMATGFVSAFVVAALSIKFLLRYIQRHTFIAFGVYRIIAAILFWLCIL